MIWHSAKLENIVEELSSDLQQGLTKTEAVNRIAQYGENRLRDKKPRSFIQRFIDQLKDFMVLILIIAAIVSMVTTILEGKNDWIEPIIIIAIVILNAVLGVIQESRAEAALDALKKMSAPTAKVLRDGGVSTVASSELVPGDIVLLEAGDSIPADGRLIESASLRCDEAALTGESVPVEKYSDVTPADMAVIADRNNMVYNGCSVTYGRGKVIITETGMNTEMGKIANILEKTGDAITPLQIKLQQLGKTLGILALVICAVIFGIGLIRGWDWLDMFMVSISLAVAAIPEGLPAIVTIVLAIGVQRMVKKNAIIRRLPAVETLGSASVICSDKTGTLTQNRMTVVKLFDGREIIGLTEGISLPEEANMLLRLGAMCCDGRVEIRDGEEIHIGDPTETAIVKAAMQYADFSEELLTTDYPRMGEIPFDSERKLMTTVNMINGKPFAVVKGAPDVLIPLCSTVQRDATLQANQDMAVDALRVLCVAVKPLESIPADFKSEELEKDLTFVGLLGMIDPPRTEAAQAVELCKSAGITTVMITGDHVITAAAIAKQLGILAEGTQAVTGEELNRMTDEELAGRIDQIRVYARVTPEDKIRIVKMWQQKGDVVAMTGDGVNDAPALKAADIGCAMGITGTDVAKGAAAMILTDDNFATIVTAVKEGRGIFDNIKKAVSFLLSCNLGEIITVFAAVLMGIQSPLLPIQLLWINLVTDSLPALALGMEPVENDVMQRKPRDKKEHVLAGGVGMNALWQGVMFAVITLAAYFIGLYSDSNNTQYAQTMAFTVLAFSQLVHAWNTRSSHSLFTIGIFKNKHMIAAFFGSVALMCAVIFTPARSLFNLVVMDASHWIYVILLSLAPLVICELVKLIIFLMKKINRKELAANRKN